MADQSNARFGIDPGSSLWSAHVHKESLPWVRKDRDIGAFRVLQARPAENFMVFERTYDPNCVSPLHRHIGHAFAFTYAGAWGHRHGEYVYLPGTYVYEPLDVVHRFHNSNQVTHCMFVVMGGVEYFDPEGKEVIGRATVENALESYLQGCEQAGLPRPNVLG